MFFILNLINVAFEYLRVSSYMLILVAIVRYVVTYRRLTAILNTLTFIKTTDCCSCFCVCDQSVKVCF